MSIATILVLAHLCAWPIGWENDRRCIQFIMDKQNCEALVARQRPVDNTSPSRRHTRIKPFTIECLPMPEKDTS